MNTSTIEVVFVWRLLPVAHSAGIQCDYCESLWSLGMRKWDAKARLASIGIRCRGATPLDSSTYTPPPEFQLDFDRC